MGISQSILCFLHLLQRHRPLRVIEHFVVVVGGDFDGVALPEKPALGHMQAHQALFPLGRRLVQGNQMCAGPRQSLRLRTVVFGQHVPLVVEPVPVFDGTLVGHHHPHVLVRRRGLLRSFATAMRFERSCSAPHWRRVASVSRSIESTMTTSGE